LFIFDNTHWELFFLSRVNSAKFANFLENFTRFFWHLSQNCKKNNPGEEDSQLLEENLPIPSLNYFLEVGRTKLKSQNWGFFKKKFKLSVPKQLLEFYIA
jgi:hypothetical protein